MISKQNSFCLKPTRVVHVFWGNITPNQIQKRALILQVLTQLQNSPSFQTSRRKKNAQALMFDFISILWWRVFTFEVSGMRQVEQIQTPGNIILCTVPILMFSSKLFCWTNIAFRLLLCKNICVWGMQANASDQLFSAINSWNKFVWFKNADNLQWKCN